MRFIPSMTVIAAAAALCSAPVVAQEMISSPVRYGITGGATVPVGDYKNVSSAGWNAGALVELGFPIVPLSFRFDAAWHQLGDKHDDSGDTFKSRVISGDLNAIYTFAPANPTKFYLIGGLGLYNFRNQLTSPAPALTGSGALVVGQGSGATETFSASSTKFGVNAGAGVRFQFTTFSMFVESRFHNIFGVHGTTRSSGNIQMIPITIGVVF
ncbi:MAG: outer membrane protein [Gemmatimonadaceae bacterium]